MRSMRLIAIITLAVALGAGGCAVEGSAPFEVVAKDFAFEGVPPTINGGPVKVTFRNEGKVSHELAFVDIGDASFEDFKREFPKIFEGGPFPSFFRSGSVPFEAEPGEEVSGSFTLAEGKYLLFCALSGDPTKPKSPEGEEAEGKEHYQLGMYVPEVKVNGGGGEVSAPDGEIVASDYKFTVPALTAGRKELVFRNESPRQWHHMVAFEYPPSITPEAAVNAFRALGQAEETGQPPPPGTPQPEEAGFAGVFSPGGAQTIHLDVKSGHTYLLACFIQDITGGPPHAIAHNMLTPFKVS